MLVHLKLLCALILLHYTFTVSAIVAHRSSAYFNGEQWELWPCYYFAFTTFSTVGFGDYALGVRDTDSTGLFYLFGQAAVIFVGLATFNTFASVFADWLLAVASDVQEALLRSRAARWMAKMRTRIRALFRASLNQLVRYSRPSLNRQSTTGNSWGGLRGRTDHIRALKPVRRRGLHGILLRAHSSMHVSAAAGDDAADPSATAPSTEPAVADRTALCKMAAWAGGAVAALCTRFLLPVLGGYAIMLLGGYLLHRVEHLPEIASACASFAEENERRTEFRLPLFTTTGCGASYAPTST